MEDEQGYRKIDAQAGDVHEGGYEGRGAGGGIEPEAAQDEGQHAAGERAEHDHADEAGPHGERQEHVVLAVVGEVQVLPEDDAEKSDDAQHEAEGQAVDEFAAENSEPVAQLQFA